MDNQAHRLPPKEWELALFVIALITILTLVVTWPST